jgi:hypothetical protein
MRLVLSAALVCGYTMPHLDDDQQPEIIVISRSVGTGGYISVYAFTFAKDRLLFRAAVEGLASDADPAEALRKPKK